MAQARRLRPGQYVDMVAPASAFDRQAFEAGCAWLESKNLRPRFRPDIFTRDRFLAGSDERRSVELLGAIEAPDSDVIWCARGGYGATRLLNGVALSKIQRAGKLLIGFSDITALHACWRRAGVPSVHGSMVARLAREPETITSRLLDMLQPGAIAPPLSGKPLTGGIAEGVLAGGNLAILATLCGTPFQPDFAGAIVILEDVGERSFRLDRMLVQCTQAGLFRGVAGLAFGEFLDCGEPDTPTSSVIAEHAARLGIPAIAELPFGHGAVNNAIPLGVRGRLDAGAGRLEFLESLT